ncbi:hypothetical protein VKS41_005559 [Umbelopsis sp. WA50703]
MIRKDHIQGVQGEARKDQGEGAEVPMIAMEKDGALSDSFLIRNLRDRPGRSESPARRRSHKRSRSLPSTDSESSSDSDGSEEEESRRSRRHSKHSKHKKDRKHKKDKKKKSKKSKKSRHGVADIKWGHYGIIHEADIFTKEPEFQAWLLEVKKVNVETIPNMKRKELFNSFMEDYNTATMPHEKFYNLQKWEDRQRAIRMGEKPADNNADFDFKKDEENLRLQQKQAARQATATPSYMSKADLSDLARVARERIEAERMRKLGLKPKTSMGVRYEQGYE